ncbi:MAG: hypothetical protein ACRD3Q_17785 [Terriglobales bacterium]
MSNKSERERVSNEGQPAGIRVEHRPDGSVSYEVLPGHELPFRVPLGEDRIVDIEIPPNPAIRVLDGRKFPQLDVPLVLVQFEVVARDWRKGWCPIGGSHYDSELYLGEPESTLVFERPGNGEVCVWGDSPDDLQLENAGAFPLYVVVRSPADAES